MERREGAARDAVVRTADEILAAVHNIYLLTQDVWDKVKDVEHIDGRRVESMVFNGYGTWLPFAGYSPESDLIYAPHWCLSRDEVEVWLAALRAKKYRHDLRSSGCIGGVASCRRCGAGEGTLPTDCPGFQLNPYIQDAIYKGGLDYIEGYWSARPPESPTDPTDPTGA